MALASEKAAGSHKQSVESPGDHIFVTGSGNDDDSGCTTDEFTWVPPGLSPDIVSVLIYY